MFKRFIARFLIFLQVYNTLFQGVLHANIVARYPVRDEIYLDTSPSKDGALRIALGTNRGGDGSAVVGSDTELLDVIEVPSYDALSKASKQQLVQVRLSPKKSDSGLVAAAAVALEALQIPQAAPLSSPVSKVPPPPALSLDAAAPADTDDDVTSDSPALFSQHEVTRAPDGAHFELQGLKIFVSNMGELLVHGKQTDFSKPIFLSCSGAVVLHNVEARGIKIIAPAILGVGKSSIDCLSLEGLNETAVYLNYGELTAKQVFLTNLQTTNTRLIETVAIEAQGGNFHNAGHLEAETKIGLGLDKFSNSGTVSADEIEGLEALKAFENNAKGQITTDTVFKTGLQTVVTNHGSLKSGDYQILGPSLQQHGKITGKRLTTGKDTVITTSDTQALVLDETWISDSTLPLALAGTVNVREFDYKGHLDLTGSLNATIFKGHGTVQPTGQLTSGHTQFTADFTNLGGVDAQVLEAAAKLSTSGVMRVRHTAKVVGALTVSPEGSLTGYEDTPLALTLDDTTDIAGYVEVTDLAAFRAVQISGTGKLLSKKKSSLAEDLGVAKDAAAELHGLRLTGGAIANQGNLRVIEVDPGSELIKVSNVGDAVIDAGHSLPISTAVIDAAGTPTRDPALEVLKVKLQVANQPTGKLTLRSGHFDLTSDEALVNEGLLSQEAANLYLTDASTWTRPRAWNTGTWQVKDVLSLLGNATAKNLGKLLVTDTLQVGPETRSQLRGVIETLHFRPSGAIEILGTLVASQSSHLPHGLTVAKDATAELHGLKLTSGEIANHGILRVLGVNPTSIILKLINTGQAMIDDQQVLPKVDEQSLENLARIATTAAPATWDAHKDSHEFTTNLSTIKTRGSFYLRLGKALKAKAPFVSKLGNEPEFAKLTQVPSATAQAIQYKQEFIDVYEALIAKSQTEGSKAEQAELQEYLKQFAEHYQQVFAKRKAYTKSLHPAVGAALLVENSSIPQVRLQLLNQATGQLALKSGKFEFMGDSGLVNDGTLIQDRAYFLWMTGSSAAFNRGTWRVKGSLGLLGYHGQNVGKIEAENSLQVSVTMDALDALRGLQEVKTKKVLMHAARVKDTTKADKVLPWMVELHLLEDFESTANLYTCGLQLFCRNFDLNGDLSADIKDGAEVLDPEQGFLRVTASHNAKIGIAGYLYGRRAAGVRSQNLTIEGREQIPGASLTDLVFPFASEQATRIIYRRAQNGIYSLDGPVCLDFTDTFTNHFGTIKGTYFVFNGRSFRNIAGFIQGTDATQSSQIIADTISNIREEIGKYQYGILLCKEMSYQGYVKYSQRFCETSPQAILEHAGDLTLIYRTLDNQISDITSAKSLFLDARRADQTLAVGEVGSRVQLDDALARTTNPHHGVTVTWDRNGQTSLIRGKHTVTGTLGSAQLAGGVHARAIALTAAQMTLQHLQLDQTPSASLVRLAQYIQVSQSSMYRLIGDGSTYDTRFALSQSSRMFPRSIVAMSANLPQNISLNLGATWRAFEHAYGQSFPYLYRGLQYLGLSFANLCEISAEEVRSRQGAQVTTHLITDGRDEREVDVVTHPALSSPQALGKAIMPMLVMEFGRNIGRVEADLDREQQAKAAAEKAKKLKERSEALLKAAQAADPEDKVDFALVVPSQETVHGLKGDGSRTDVRVTDGDFTALGAPVSGHGGSIEVTRGGVKLLSQTQRVYTGDVLHQDESFQDVALRAGVANYGRGDDREFRIVSATGIDIEGARFKAAAPDSLISMTTPGPIVDRALALTSRQTTESYGKDSYTKTVADETIADPTQYAGLGSMHQTSGTGVVLQAPDISCSMRVSAPSLALLDAQNFRSVQSTTESHSVSFLGGARKKTTTSVMRAFFSSGGKLKGPEFIANVGRFSATHLECDTKGTVTATEGAELSAGRSSMTSHTKTESEDMIWKRVEVTAERHFTHQPCTFAQPFTVHAPAVTMERIAGSGAPAHLVSTSPVQYTDLVDIHEHHHHSQKSLTAGAAMIVKLAIAVAAMYAAPLAGALGGGIPGAMVSAGVGTLCGDTAVCLIENDGDLGRTMRELGKRDVVKNVARSMLAAGLVHGISELASTSTAVDAAAEAGTGMASGASTTVDTTARTLTAEMASKPFEEYAKQAVIQSAVNTALAVAMDGQDFAEALKQGIAMAGINTVASWAAGKIGDLYKFDAADRINYATHKALHGMLGAGMGATLAAVTHTDPRIGALSGAVGAVVGEMVAEGFSPDQADIEKHFKASADKSQAESEIMTSATRAASWGAFAGALGAFGLGLDVGVAHTAGRNATEHNYLTIVTGLCLAFYAQHLYNNFIADVKAEGIESALGKLGIKLVQDATIALAVETGIGVAPVLFEVGGVACKTLGEALRLAKANPTATQEIRRACQSIERNLPEMEQLVQALRPTARQSERDIGLMMGDGYKPQISFKDGGQIRYGMQGSTRPDFIFHDLSHCIEVKNYLVSSESGISRLVSDVSAQALKRQAQIPAGMQQKVFIDVRGQTVNEVQEILIKKGIFEKSKGVIQLDAIRLLRGLNK